MVMDGHFDVVFFHLIFDQSQEFMIGNAYDHPHTCRIGIIKSPVYFLFTLHIDNTTSVEVEAGFFNFLGNDLDLFFRTFQRKMETFKTNAG